MKKTELKPLEYYIKLPWQFEFEYCPEDDAYTARVKGLMCYSNGKTLEEATKNIKEALNFHLESLLEDGIEPCIIDENLANGKINIRTSKKTHLRLLQLSKEENVSVSHLVNDAIIKQYG